MDMLTSAAEAIVKRLPMAELVRRVDLQGALPGHCHQNAALWIEENPNDCLVRGFLILDGDEIVVILAHSVVRTDDGHLIDVTPAEREPLPFIESEFTDAIFERFVVRQRVAYVRSTRRVLDF